MGLQSWLFHRFSSFKYIFVLHLILMCISLTTRYVHLNVYQTHISSFTDQFIPSSFSFIFSFEFSLKSMFEIQFGE